jgi:hypothetical protein
MASDACIVQACEQSWEESFIAGRQNKNNCSGFVKAVAQKLHVPMVQGLADDIVDYLSSHPSWEKLADGAMAKNQASRGYLVIACQKGADYSPPQGSGHVAIVIDGILYRDKYPVCWGGSTGNAQSRGNKSVGEVWNPASRDRVLYYCYIHSAVCAI